MGAFLCRQRDNRVFTCSLENFNLRLQPKLPNSLKGSPQPRNARESLPGHSRTPNQGNPTLWTPKQGAERGSLQKTELPSPGTDVP